MKYPTKDEVKSAFGKKLEIWYAELEGPVNKEQQTILLMIICRLNDWDAMLKELDEMEAACALVRGLTSAALH